MSEEERVVWRSDSEAGGIWEEIQRRRQENKAKWAKIEEEMEEEIWG